MEEWEQKYLAGTDLKFTNITIIPKIKPKSPTLFKSIAFIAALLA